MRNTLSRLQEWYRAQCDGDWEHGYGIEIGTLDNPGWRLQVNLEDTELASLPFETYEDRYDDETDWLRAWRDATTFHVACGPTRLEDAIVVFLNWAEENGASSAG